MAAQAVKTDGSSVKTGVPLLIALPASRAELTRAHEPMPASRNARSPCSSVRLEMATRRIPGAGVAS